MFLIVKCCTSCVPVIAASIFTTTVSPPHHQNLLLYQSGVVGNCQIHSQQRLISAWTKGSNPQPLSIMPTERYWDNFGTWLSLRRNQGQNYQMQILEGIWAWNVYSYRNHSASGLLGWIPFLEVLTQVRRGPVHRRKFCCYLYFQSVVKNCVYHFLFFDRSPIETLHKLNCLDI